MCTLYVTNKRFPVPFTDKGCRTQEQFEAVRSLLPDVDFVCGNPFEKHFPEEEYNCTFAFTYYGHDGELHLARITPTGQVRHVRINED